MTAISSGGPPAWSWLDWQLNFDLLYAWIPWKHLDEPQLLTLDLYSLLGYLSAFFCLLRYKTFRLEFFLSQTPFLIIQKRSPEVLALLLVIEAFLTCLESFREGLGVYCGLQLRHLCLWLHLAVLASILVRSEVLLVLWVVEEDLALRMASGIGTLLDLDGLNVAIDHTRAVVGWDCASNSWGVLGVGLLFSIFQSRRILCRGFELFAFESWLWLLFGFSLSFPLTLNFAFLYFALVRGTLLAARGCSGSLVCVKSAFTLSVLVSRLFASSDLLFATLLTCSDRTSFGANFGLVLTICSLNGCQGFPGDMWIL